MTLHDAKPAASQPSAFNFQTILFAVFRHKWLVLSCAVLGFAVAAAFRHLYPVVYESQAKLLVRYILERSTVDAIDGQQRNGASASPVLTNEAEILRSWDLAVQVADAVGVQQLVKGPVTADSKERAAAAVASGLKISTQKTGSILLLAYQNAKPELTTPVLNELVNRYFVRHLEVHRSAGAFDFVSQQTDQVRARLNQTEDALRVLNEKVGVASLGDSTAAITAEMLRTEEQLRSAEADAAEQQARVQALESGPPAATAGTSPASSPAMSSPAAEAATAGSDQAPAASSGGESAPPAATPSPQDTEQYRLLTARREQLRDAEVSLGAKYTAESNLMKSKASELASVQDQLKQLETKFPMLVGTGSKTPDVITERARLAGTIAKVEKLKARLQEVRARFKQLSDVTPQIVELQRRKEMEETNLKYFQSSLEKARIDEALDPSKIPNISAVQRPTPPQLVTGNRDKIALGLAGGGLVLGLALAIAIEMFLNRTVKRPLEIESDLHVPLLLSIPRLGTNGHFRLPFRRRVSRNGSANAIAPWEPNHFIRAYSEAIRDRLGLYFELNNLLHKPKLIGVTGFSEGAGTSTLAAGVAAALSEVGDGKVLLVDVKLGPGEVHPFFRGRPALPLSLALTDGEEKASAAENLYLATVGSSTGGIAQLGLKKFFDLMPTVKASDFDYIIFDMPPLTTTSPTVGMAGFMDKILLVVEAEKVNREVVKRGYATLTTERNNVSVVLNKTRSYVPKSVSGEW